VGLSAPQIAENKRVFVVSGKVFDKDYMTGKTKQPIKGIADEYFINPVIKKVSKKLAIAEEGCLSIPNTYGMVKRPIGVTMEYRNFSGETLEKKATGLLARIFQHEVDHLDGILFTDKATNVKQGENTHENTEL
jgi:peptide deformylase